MSSVMKLAARVGLEAGWVGDGCGGESELPQAWRRGEGTAGVVGLMPFVRIRGVEGGAGTGAPLGRPLTVVPFCEPRAAGADAEDGIVEAADPLTLVPVVAPARCGEDDVASSPTRLRLLSALGFSGASLIVDREDVDPKLGDW